MYPLSLFLTVIDILGIVAGPAFIYGASFFYKLTPIEIGLAIGLSVVCIILYPFINKLRQKARTAAKYDQYGRLKQFGNYEKMSVQEQKEFDKQRMKDMERLLPTTMVREMTKRGSAKPDEDLKNLTGLQSVKQKVEEMEARMEMERRDKKKNKQTEMSRHMVFFGPPGTGKTTVAAIMTAYLKKYGYIQDNRFMIANGSFFSGAESSKKVDAVVQRAFGGVLFIDEAYAMMQGMNGDEAVSALLSQMEDNRDKFVLIMAGYEDEMKDLLKSNPGFLSRIAEFLYFENYSIAELLQIFKGMAKKEGYSVSEDGEDEFRIVINQALKENSFGNARTCRSILDKSISRHCLNIKRSKKKDDYVLTEDDIVYEANPLAN